MGQGGGTVCLEGASGSLGLAGLCFIFRVTKVDNNPTLFFRQATVQQPDELELTGSWAMCPENGMREAAQIRPQNYERGSWQKDSALEWGTSHVRETQCRGI